MTSQNYCIYYESSQCSIRRGENGDSRVNSPSYPKAELGLSPIICVLSENMENISSKVTQSRELAKSLILTACIHLSNVLTDHFSNSLPEKTTKDIPIKFSQYPLKNIFYRLQLSNRGIY